MMDQGKRGAVDHGKGHVAILEPILWKLIASAIWQACIVAIATLLFAASTFPPLSPSLVASSIHSLISLRTWACWAGLCVFQAPLFLAHWLLMTPHEQPPITAWSLVAGGGGGKGVNSYAGAPKRLAQVLAMLGASLAAGAMCVPIALQLGTGHEATWADAAVYGAVLGAAYALDFLGRGLRVLQFPAVCRHRFFRLKQSLPAACRVALIVAPLARAVHAAAGLIIPALGGAPPAIRVHIQMVVAGALCSLCWAMAAQVLNVIHTEPYSFGRPGGRGPLAEVGGVHVAALEATGGDPILHHLAVQDLCTCANHGSCKAVFADSSGQMWTALAGASLSPLIAITKQLVRAGQQQQPPPPAAHAQQGSGQARRGWNSKQQVAAVNLAAGRAAVAAAGFELRAGYVSLAWRARTLAALGAASRREDVYGVAQLQQPPIGEVVSSLLSCLHALEAYSAAATAMPGNSSAGGAAWAAFRRIPRLFGMNSAGLPPAGSVYKQSVDWPAHALQDSLLLALHTLARSFGKELLAVLASHKAPPASGTKEEHQARLNNILGSLE